MPQRMVLSHLLEHGSRQKNAPEDGVVARGGGHGHHLQGAEGLVGGQATLLRSLASLEAKDRRLEKH